MTATEPAEPDAPEGATRLVYGQGVAPPEPGPWCTEPCDDLDRCAARGCQKPGGPA